MEYDLVKKYVEQKLLGLSDLLTYHNAWHTLGDVLPSAERLAKALNIKGEKLILLKTAALFHDVGYLEKHKDNELVGASMAVEQLPKYGYSDKQIDVVKQLILATQMPQSPSTLLEEILCDADLDSLGRSDFFELSQNLLTELNCYGVFFEKNEWYKKQKCFLENHSYFTSVSSEQNKQGKQDNINLLNSYIDFQFSGFNKY